MEQTTLRNAVNVLCGDKEETKTFKYYLKRSLRQSGSLNIILQEDEVIELHDGFVTICFTWDMISAVNNITNKYVDLTCPQNAFSVFD